MLNPKLPPIEDLRISFTYRMGSYEIPLERWLLSGPKDDPLKEIPEHMIASHGQQFPLHLLPIRYRNTEEAHRLILKGLIPEPWPDYIVRLKKSLADYDAFRREARKTLWKEMFSAVNTSLLRWF